MSEDKLQLIINDSGLETTKARVLLENFKDYFDIADEWETKAKTIVVTDEKQKPDMAMARVGRLFLRDKRIAIEKTRKDLKEQSLREGKAIDGIANILKSLIVPIEEYLEKQEKFIEIRDAEIAEQKRIEADQLLREKEEAERIAREKAEIAERERIRKENETLRAEAIERERLAKIEREKQERLLAEQRAKAESERKESERLAGIERAKHAEILAKQQAEADAKRKEIEEQNRKEREIQTQIYLAQQERIIAEHRAKADAERIALQKKAELERKGAESDRLAFQKKIDEQRKASEKLKKILNEVECPFCHKKFTLN